MAANASGVSAPSGSPAPAAKAPPSPAPRGGASSSAPPPSSKGQRVSGDSIMEAVDGEGVAPSLAKPDAPGAPDSKKAGKGLKGGADKRAQAAESIPTDSEPFDPLAAFTEALGPQETETTQEDPLANDDGTPMSKSAQERFQALTKRASAAEERANTMEQQVGQAFQQFQGEMRRMQDHNHKLEVQLARMGERMQLMGRAQAEGQLTPEQEFERDMAQRISSPLERKLMGNLQAVQREVQQLRQERAQDRRDQEIRQNKARYSNEARFAARNTVLEGFSDEEARDLLSVAQDDVLATAWAKRTNAAEAAKIVRSKYLRYGLAFIKAQSRINQQRRQQADQAPNAPPRSSADGSGEVEPTFDELRAAGFNGMNPFMDWELAGRPPLRKAR